MINDEPWLVASDVCKILEFKNPSDILKRLDKTEKGKIPESRVVVDPILNIGSAESEVNIVNEPGFYHLVFSSRKKEACAFQYWVYHKILPSIRKTGSYSIDTLAKPALPKIPLKIFRVYALKMSNGNIKIGYSKRLCDRFGEIKHDSNSAIDNIYFTPCMFREDAHLVERCCKEVHFSRKVKGEFFLPQNLHSIGRGIFLWTVSAKHCTINRQKLHKDGGLK